MPTEEQLQAGFSLGEWDVFPETGSIRCGDNEVSPEPQTWRVLIALAKRDGGLVTRNDLIEDVWDGRAVSDDPINRAIREVRKCFGDSAKHPTVVATLPKRGYRLLLPVRLHEVAGPESNGVRVAPGPGRARLRTMVAILVIGFLAIIAYIWQPPPPVQSIAVLPFQNLTGVVEDQYLVAGFKEVLVVNLAGVDGLLVKSVGINYSGDTADIGDELGVENVLQGALRREGGEIRVSFQISKGQKGIVQSGEVIGDTNALFDAQEELATLVVRSLLGSSEQTLITSRPNSSAAYDSYMRGMFALQHRGDGQNLEYSIELFTNAIAIDQSYGPSYLGLATAYALMPDYRRGVTDQTPVQWNELATTTIDQGVKNDPMIASAAGSIYGFIYHKQKRWLDSEEAHLTAVSGRIVDSNAFNWYSRMLASVGRMDDALAMALRAVEIDPSSAVINSRIAITYTWLEQSKEAHEYFQRANDLGASGYTHLLGYALLLARDGHLERARNLTTAVVQKNGTSSAWVEATFAAFEDSAKQSAAVAAVDRAWADKELAPQVAFVARALLGDTDGAMDIAQLLDSDGDEPFEMDLLFIPELKALRQHPDFMPLLDRLNVTTYWTANDCTWNGDEVSCPGH